MAKTELLYGLHSIEAVLKNHPERVLELFIQQEREDQRIEQLCQLAHNFGLVAQRLQAKRLDHLLAQEYSGPLNHQGVVAR